MISIMEQQASNKYAYYTHIRYRGYHVVDTMMLNLTLHRHTYRVNRF